MSMPRSGFAHVCECGGIEFEVETAARTIEPTTVGRAQPKLVGFSRHTVGFVVQPELERVQGHAQFLAGMCGVPLSGHGWNCDLVSVRSAAEKL